ncbi:MAG TPA: porin [Methylophilus sp.]
MTSNLKKTALHTAVALACGLAMQQANAGATISFGEDKSISVGLGMRTEFSSTEDAASNGSSRSKDFSLDSLRLYMNASLNKYIKATFNTEKKSNGNQDSEIGIIDGIAQFEFMPEFNVWAGRMLPGSDRANLDGPYYLLAWQYPFVSNYANKTTGRDDGVAVWGKLLEGRLIYNVGAYEGNTLGTRTLGTPTGSDQLKYAGRLQYDFWTPNGAPAFYTGSTTFGTADVLSIGIAGQAQQNGAVSTTAMGDYKAWNVDFLMEKVIGSSGAVTLEGAYYKYDTDKVIAAYDGKAYLGGIGYIFADKVGWGQFQPYIRYQKYDYDVDVVKAAEKQMDYGLNYVIDGFNAKITAVYSKTDYVASKDVDKFIVGLQLQF